VDDQSFEELVRSVSKELASGTDTRSAPRGRGRFFLVDNWRIRSAERERFLDYYATHVADTMREIDGYVDARILVAAVEASYSWHVQVFYEFQSDTVLDRFKDDFNRITTRRFPGKTMETVLDDMSEWVLAHEDGALIEIDRQTLKS
jgi:type III secretory pathway component EscV